MSYDQINKRHLSEGMSLTYRTSDEQYIEKARKAEPIGTIKQMGGREVIKTVNGWRAHTKGSGKKTKEHLEKNPSANHKDEHLEKFSKETPETELRRVIKESTDPRLREHAQKELARRKDEESGDGTKKIDSLIRKYGEGGGKDTKLKDEIIKLMSAKDASMDKINEALETTINAHKESTDETTGKWAEHDKKKGSQKISHDDVVDDATASFAEHDKKKKDQFDLKGENPYKKGQEVSYKTSDRFDNEWVEHTKVVSNHPSGHVLLDNGAKMHHTELQKKEHEHKRNLSRRTPRRL